MPLFRFQKGSLDESLKTTIIVKTFNEMVKAILDSFEEPIITRAHWGASFAIKPYPSQNNCFDARIGWYTQIVTTNFLEQNKMQPIGYLSEPF
jgi:hypothetical protein